uniref:Reverse transcriptase RNase H-like domain-containing protein n=1 Tax=Manihot esculenta TaxID=3983 RepID=A0A2C9V8V2_MANES
MFNAPVLRLSYFIKLFVVETDASGTGMGIMLQQEGHPIAFIFKDFGPRTKGLSVYEREQLAITFAVAKWSKGNRIKQRRRLTNFMIAATGVPLSPTHGLTYNATVIQWRLGNFGAGNRRGFLVMFFDAFVQERTLLLVIAVVAEVVGGVLKQQLCAKLSKCSFGKIEVDYLEHIISAAGVSTDPMKIQTIINWPSPWDIKELRSFVGLTGSLSIIMDASGTGMGIMLQQEGHPIAFIFKDFGLRIKGLSVYEREQLAITIAVAKWRYYLEHGLFFIKTDNESIKQMRQDQFAI